MKKTTLSDIYNDKILLKEGSDNVVAPTGDMKIAKDDKVPLASTGGDEKVKKDIEDPEEHNEFSQEELPMKENKEQSQQETETTAYEGAFEKLFKKALTEDLGEDMASDMSADVEVPTSDEDMVDELESDTDEVSDLASDLKDVISSLQSILDKIADEQTEEPSEEETDYSEFEESVDAKELGHALHNLKAGTDLIGPKGKMEVKGAVKTSKGKAASGDVDDDPKLKPAKAHDKGLQNPKTKPEVKSTVKKGEFFK